MKKIFTNKFGKNINSRFKGKSEVFNLKYLPFILVFFVMLAPILIDLLKISSPTKFEKLMQLNAQALTETPKVNASWTWSGMLAGSWQKALEAELSGSIPFRARIVRLHNQIFYSFFSKSYMVSEALIIGKNNFLFTVPFLKKYCNSMHTEYSRESFEQWANDLKTIETYFKNRGQHFVFLITPSKAAYYPEYIPNNYPCQKNNRLDYKLAIQALQKNGVTYVDGSAITLKNKEKYGELMFPRGGIHWSSLASAFTAQAILKALRQDGTHIPLLHYSYFTDDNPQGYDSDIIELANLLHPPIKYTVPHLTIKPDESSHDKELKLTAIGGSFLTSMIDTLHNSHIFSSIDYYFYFDIRHSQYKPNAVGQILKADLDVNDFQNFAEIFNADVIILEENENLLQSPHIGKFVSMLNKTQHTHLTYHELP